VLDANQEKPERESRSFKAPRTVASGAEKAAGHLNKVGGGASITGDSGTDKYPVCAVPKATHMAGLRVFTVPEKLAFEGRQLD
jgi:hypothetical protein